jgi:transcriptional regulator
MYIPSHFAESDRRVLHDLIRTHSFGLLVTTVEDDLLASHLPFLLDPEAGENGTLIAHMARANPHWRGFAHRGDSLAVFQGPHAYVSPTWYGPGRYVPTWNYAVVHAYGRPRVIEDAAAVRAVLERLVTTHETSQASPWRLDAQEPAYIDRMMGGIVAFEIPIERLDGKFKLSQDKPAAARAGVIAALGESAHPDEVATSALMQSREPG